jgi:Kef-type K+ transport system membrane component KefB
LRIPSVVVMIAAGIVFGSSGVSLIHVDGPLQILALLGLAFLLFLAGLEIDVRRLRGNLLRVALAGYALTLALGGVAGMLFGILDWVRSPLLLAVTLSATSLGLIVPVLSDADQAETHTGLLVIAASSVAEFGSVLLLSLLFSTSGGTVGERIARPLCSQPWWRQSRAPYSRPAARYGLVECSCGCKTPPPNSVFGRRWRS